MRFQSNKTLMIRNKILGGAVPWICLPLVAEGRDTLLQQANDVLGYQPDALEWRPLTSGTDRVLWWEAHRHLHWLRQISTDSLLRRIQRGIDKD